MKNTLKLSLTFAATLMASNAFAEGAHHGKMEGEIAAKDGHIGMMGGPVVHDGMKMDKMAMMKERAAMMSKCADELEKDTPNPAELKLCAKMMRKQADMMESCMEKGCDMMGNMMKKGKKSHHGAKTMAAKK